MKYRAVPRERAAKALDKVRGGDPLTSQDFTVRGQGDLLSDETMDALRMALEKAKGKYPKQLSARHPAGGKWEAEACSLVHRILDLPPDVAGDYEFWIWLALELHEFVDWRHGDPDAPAKAANFGVRDSRENLFYRMWLRADIACVDDAKDPYKLATRGGNDFWRSHILRIHYGRSRPLARALIRAQFPDRKRGKPRWKTAEIRDIAKRLLRLHPTVLFEALHESDAAALIEREASASLKSLAAQP